MAEVSLSTHARKSYERLARSDPRLFARVDRALDRLAEEPAAGKPLQGPLQGRRSLRVGPVRIIYRMELAGAFVMEISPRGEAYRGR